MKTHVEHLISIIRIFDDNMEYGDPYIWSATLKFIDIETVEIVGVDKPITISMYRVIKKALIDMGVVRAIFYRYKNSIRVRRESITSTYID